MVKKPGMGRRKIEIKRIQNEDARQVCFSKRKAGLIKKAQELSILTGAEIAVLIFSQAGKPFSFGYPSVDAVIDRFLGHPVDTRTALALSDPALASALASLAREHDELLGRIAGERKLRVEMDRGSKTDGKFWWECNVEDIPVDRLERYGVALEELRRNVVKKADELTCKARLEGKGYCGESSCLSVVESGSGFGSGLSVVDPLVGFGDWKKHGLDLMVLEDQGGVNKDHGQLFF